MAVAAIVQARLGSVRLPRKVIRPINGVPLIDLLLTRLGNSRLIDKIIVATTDLPRDDELAEHLNAQAISIFRGSETDVLSRFFGAAKTDDYETIVRITGDCPLVDPELVDETIRKYQKCDADYVSNTHQPTYPDGLDVEVFSFKALEIAQNETSDQYDREHVTPFLYNSGLFKLASLSQSNDLSMLRLTVDEPRDLANVEMVFRHFAPKKDFTWKEAVDFISGDLMLLKQFTSDKRNEGAQMSNGQKMWQRAKATIPGGNMLLSKRPEMFLPDHWPTYFESAKGCSVTDLDGNTYLDMSLMGVGTNVLGYGNPQVDEAVTLAIQKGNMSTLNCPEEVELAERLIELNPFADMARFARSGGEANAIAVRIGRASSGRDNVAVCGYHGWHDWYLSANLGDENNLAGHLLPGLDPAGVPKALKSCVFPFDYNDFAKLEELVSNRDIGVIKMEVMRNEEPRDDFLSKVRKLADDNNIVLIFDECTSGFRETYGGLYLKYSVEPDIAVFGKTLGNGYAITAVLGRRSVMEAAQSTFISSTFWTERIGSVAALKALQVMEELKSWETITAIGTDIHNSIASLASDHGLSISQAGMPAIGSYSFTSDDRLAYKTLVSQEMLKRGFLATTAVYATIAHTPDIVERYLDNLSEVFAIIARCENGEDINSYLEGPICHSGFKRLN